MFTSVVDPNTFYLDPEICPKLDPGPHLDRNPISTIMRFFEDVKFSRKML